MVQELIVCVVSAALAVTVFVAGIRLRPKSWHLSEDDTAGELVLDVVRNLFIAVVAFVVVLCWQQYDNAQTHTIDEAKALTETYWLAHTMPEPEHQRIQGLVREYTERVAGEEWTVMDHEGRLSRSAQQSLDALRDAVQSVQPADESAADNRTEALEKLEDVADSRHEREMDVRRGIPGFITIALIFGTILLVLSPVFSGIRVTTSSILMIALLGVVIGLTLWEIRNLDRPFSGSTLVPKDAFEQALVRYGQIS
ncbi:DUF4239 domain-containing protein [Nocardia sp. BMG51109]|uniref:bestrophin-like domain n=1 Tax=Nocardia sp. BMG51109 TaxID=1056816 RepID=UPI0004641D66|nr:DUF4239 domain-containing protein [Nocardia sp. BMG51109]